MKVKSEVFQYLKHFQMIVEKEVRVQVKCLRSNGGGEYFSNDFSRFLDEQGIKSNLHVATPHNKMEM